MIERYEWTLWLVHKGRIGLLFTLNTTAAYHFRIFKLNGPVSCSSEIQGLLLHPRQQGRPGWVYMIKQYYWTLWLVPKGRNGLIYTLYPHCTLSFWWFWSKWARQLQQWNTMTSTPSQTTGLPRNERHDWILPVNALNGPYNKIINNNGNGNSNNHTIDKKMKLPVLLDIS